MFQFSFTKRPLDRSSTHEMKTFFTEIMTIMVGLLKKLLAIILVTVAVGLEFQLSASCLCKIHSLTSTFFTEIMTIMVGSLKKLLVIILVTVAVGLEFQLSASGLCKIQFLN